jgi:hypothetical protein
LTKGPEEDAMNEDDKNLRKIVWTVAYLTALHAMLPRDAPPGLMTTPFNENAKGVADDAIEHFDEFSNKVEGR